MARYPTSRADRIAQDIARQKNAEFLAKQSRPLVSDSTIDSLKRLEAEDAELLTKQQVPDTSAVICPACAHQFRAIPEQVQKLLLGEGYGLG